VLDRVLPDGRALRIGLLSFLPPQTVDWDAHLLAGRVETDDIVDSAREWVPRLRDVGCDIVVVLAHCGIGAAQAEDRMENALIPLAALPGIDAIIAGHTHRRIPGPDHDSRAGFDADQGRIHGVPVVMPAASGSCLGVIDLDLAQDGHGHWAVAGASAALRAIAERDAAGHLRAVAAEDPALVALLEQDHRDTVAMMAQPVGHSGEAMHSYFTFFAPDRSLAVVAAAQAAAVRPHLAGTYAADLPLLSAVAPGKFGARAGPDFFTDVPAGPLALRHLADLQIFPNDLTAVLVTGAQLGDWLEMSASLFQQIAPGADEAMLLDPEIPGHEFDVIYGLRYRIDLSRAPRFFPDGSLRSPQNRRTLAVRWNDTPIHDDQLFVVAVNSFRASGGGHFESLRGVQQIPLPRSTVRDALRSYVSGEAGPDPLERAHQPWAFQPMPGTRVCVKTGPGAAKHLSELAERGVEPRGIDRDGFLRLSVPL
jgi:2',3'-cyclic-nucleotide 2'-phosphodiesterase/3'-nucleotidase